MNPDQKASQDEAWLNQLKFVIHLTVVANKLMSTDDETEDRIVILSFEEADVLWKEMDNYNYGYISGNLLQRWLE
jgi:hypothetical protein